MDGVITSGGALTVQADGDNLADADAFVGGLGAVTISGGAALGFITSTADVEATLASTASIHVTGAILVTATSDNDANADTDIGGGGVATFGKSATTAILDGGTKAQLDGDVIDTDAGVASPVTVRATSDNDARAEAIVVALGVFADSKGLADAIVTGLANTEALVGTTTSLSVPGGDVLVEALSDNNAIAHTAGGGGALVSLAELKPTATVGGGTNASFDGDLAGAATLTVRSRTGNDAQANAQIVNMTLLVGGTGAHAEASVTGNNEASIGSNASVQTTGLVWVDAGQDTDNFADANVFGAGTGIVASGTVGASTTVSATVRAKMDGVITDGGALTVAADGDNVADADAFVAGLGAVTTSGGVALAEITGMADVEATVASTASIHVTGAILVTAASDNDANADTDVAGGGVATFGKSTTTATIEGGTKAQFDGDVTQSSGVTVRATSDNDARAEAIVGGLGVFSNSKGWAEAQVTGLADTQALVGTAASLSVLGGDVLVEALSDNNAIAHTAGGAGALVSLAELKPTATVGGGTKASFDGDLAGAATLTVRTRTGNDAQASAQIVNMTLLGGGTGAHAEASVTGNNEASIGADASIQTTGLVWVDAGQNGDNIAGAHAFGGGTGFINSGSVSTSAVVSAAVRAKMDGVITGGGALTVQADGDNLADADAFVAGLSGLGISGGGAFANIAETADVEATLASTASIHVAGAILVTALSDNDAQADSDVGAGGVVTIGTSQPNARVAGGTKAQFDADVVDTNAGDSFAADGAGNLGQRRDSQFRHGEFWHVQPKQRLVNGASDQ
jgi:hypothetical protein